MSCVRHPLAIGHWAARTPEPAGFLNFYPLICSLGHPRAPNPSRPSSRPTDGKTRTRQEQNLKRAGSKFAKGGRAAARGAVTPKTLRRHSSPKN